MKHILLTALLCVATTCYGLPHGFVYLESVAPGIQQEIRYATPNNFIGRRIAGYLQPRCILTLATAKKLASIQTQLKGYGLGLKVYDCYRPQNAVNDFITWSLQLNDQKMKGNYYPRINKKDVFKLNYVAIRSGHSRGSTVDLTIVYLDSKKPEPPMGSHFDFLDPVSNPLSKQVSIEELTNRLFLRKMMLHSGFMPLETEWWHFTLKDEPYPHTYFNFNVQ